MSRKFKPDASQLTPELLRPRLTCAEARKYIGCSLKTLYLIIENEGLKTYTSHGIKYIMFDDLMKHISENPKRYVK